MNHSFRQRKMSLLSCNIDLLPGGPTEARRNGRYT